METMAPADGETVEAVEGVHLTQLAADERMSVQHFHIESGATVPEHSHHHEQAGFVAGGALTFSVDGETHVVGTGESFVIPGGEPHADGPRLGRVNRGQQGHSPGVLPTTPKRPSGRASTRPHALRDCPRQPGDASRRRTHRSRWLSDHLRGGRLLHAAGAVRRSARAVRLLGDRRHLRERCGPAP